jgi:hypothetical protein
MIVIALIVAIAGMAPGIRAALEDLKQRRWIWAGLDILSTVAAAMARGYSLASTTSCRRAFNLRFPAIPAMTRIDPLRSLGTAVVWSRKGETMGSKEAYDAIRKALASNPRTSIVDCFYDDATFGNFVIAFDSEGQSRPAVNDRGKLALCNDFSGTHQCKTVVPSIADADERAVLEALDF